MAGDIYGGNRDARKLNPRIATKKGGARVFADPMCGKRATKQRLSGEIHPSKILPVSIAYQGVVAYKNSSGMEVYLLKEELIPMDGAEFPAPLHH